MAAVVGGEIGLLSFRGNAESNVSGKGKKVPPDGDRMGCG